MDVLLKKLGIEKEKDLNRDFDYFYDLYKQKALDFGKKGELKFVKEHGKVVIFVVIEECEYPDSDESF